MLYAFSVLGKMLLFSGTINPVDYDRTEKIASDILNQVNAENANHYSALLCSALAKAGINIKPLNVKKVFRPYILRGSISEKD